MKRACDAHGADYYDRFSKWCDEYFFIKYRNEPRGVGGIFYDYLENDWEKDFAFTREVGLAVLAVFPEIVRAAHERDLDRGGARTSSLSGAAAMPSSTCVYDRGTRFGLMTGGNVEAILMSLPPEVRWP